MGDENSISIFHFDDEWELVDWIPEVLRNRIRLAHPSWVDGEPVAEEGDGFYSFRFTSIRPAGASTCIIAAIARWTWTTSNRNLIPGPGIC